MSNRGMLLTWKPKNLCLLSLMAMFSLFSSAITAAQTTVSPTSVNFGNVVVGTAGALHEVTFKNTGASSISVSSISVTAGGPYALAAAPSTTCPNPGSLAAGASCYVGLKLTPTALGAQPAGALTINSTAASGGTQTVALSGTGVNATALSVTAVNFYGVVVNTTSAPKGIYLANYELTPITVSPIAVAAPYAISSDTCGSTLGPNASCLIGITLTPTALGVVAPENLTINTSAPNSPLTASLAGTGSAPTQLSPASLNFGSVVVGSTSAIKSATLYNWQLTPLSILSMTPPAQYAVASTTCGSTLAGSSTCIVSLTLTPTAVGPVPAGSLKIVTNASDSPDILALSGSGAGPTVLSPTAVNFGSVVENSASPLRIVTLTNEQPTNLTVSSLALTAGTPYAIDPSSTCLTPTVLPGASCTVALTVTPASVGAQPAGTLTITTSASNSPQTVALSATGTAPVILSASALNLGHVIVGTTSAATSLTVRNLQTSALNFTGAVFNGPFVLDTGAVTTCPQSGGTLSGSLAAGASCVVGIDFKPTALGQTTGGQIALLDSAPNSPQTVMLVGVGVAPVQVVPAALGFGSVVVGTTSAAKSVTLTNNQSSALNLSSISAPAPYAVGPGTTGTACVVGTPVAPGASCTLNVTFTPTALGAAPADNLSIVDNGTNSPQLVSLSGNGVAAITLPTALVFGNVVVDEVTTKSVTLTNNQAIGLNISSISGFSGGYTLNATATTCSLTSALPAAKSCVIAVNLTPPALGVQPAASFSVADGVAGSPRTLNLTANAITAVVVSPGSLSFPTTFVGLTSAAKTVTLTNEQSIPLTISSAVITGADPADFALTSACPTAPATLSGPGACTLNVTFTPIASGTRTATLTITDGVTGSPQSIALSGPGNAPVTVTPGATQNYAVAVGTTSAYRAFTISNLQTATTLHFSSFKLEGDFIQSATTCPIGGIGIAPGASCTLAVQFDPSIGGIRNGQLQVYDDALTSPQVVNLSGSGVFPLTISPGGYTYQSQTVGTVSPAKAFTLTNHETEQETFSIAAVGSLAAADYTANTNCASGVIAAQSSCLIYVNFTPTSISPSPTRTGTLTVTDSAPGGAPITAPLSGSAIATNPPAAVSVVSPGAGSSGTVVPVIITGNGWTHFSNSSTITFVETTSPTTACDIAVSAIAAPTANTINATLTISGGIYGACNIAVKTPLSGGGTETASLISAFTIADPTQAHTVASVTPAFGSQGETMNVAIAAVGTHFVQGVTIANFGDGVSMNSLTIKDATDATANITISNTTPIGYRTVTMQTNGEFAVSGVTPQGNAIFQIGPNNATLVSVSPTSEAQGWSGQVTLTATGTHFLQNATQVTIGGAIVGDVNVTSPTVAVAEVAVAAGAPLGPQNVQVATGGEITGLPNAFTITGATPALLSVVPSSGIQGQQNLNVVITGNAFTTFTTGALSADFTGEISVNSVTPTAANSATVNISIHTYANVGSITATLVSGTTNFPFTFTVLPSSASIVSVSPTCVPQGGQLTLSVLGSNTNWVQGTTTSAFYLEGVPTPSVDEVTINSPTSASLAVAVPTSSPAGTYGFYLATGGQIVSASIKVCPATPTLTMSPANGLLPTAPAVNSFTVNFTGQFTHWGATTLPVISGEGVTLSNFVVQTPVSATGTITIIAGTNGTPTATGSRLVTFTTGGEIVTTNFNVTSTPVGIISVSPDHTPPSTTVNVAIVGLNTHFTSGTTQVLFGPQITVNSVTVTDATHLTANVTTSYMLSGTLTPSPSGWQSVYVNTGAEQVIAGFLVDYPTLPSLVSVSPSSGAQGATLSDVVITGNLTSWTQGTTEAILGAGVTVSNLTVTSPTSATATIAISPTAPIGGNTVVMITGTEIESGSGFSVTPSAAFIQSVGPAVACTGNFSVAGIPGCGTGSSTPWVVAQLQTTSLNIVGVGTHWLQGETAVSFGSGVIVDQLTVSSPTTATVQITVLSTAPVGFATLTTTTDGEVVALQQAIDIEEGSPILLAISPNAGQQGTTATVQILGRFTNFNSSTTSAAFNQDITVTSINVIDSENMTANITISPNAYVDSGSPCGHVLTITTGNEQVSTSQTPGSEYNFCVQQGAEEITTVAPNSGLQGSSESVTITGSATNFINGVSTVSLGDSGIAEGTVVVTSPTSLTVPLAISTSSATGFHTVTVTTLGEVATQQFAFTVTPGVATLNEAIPNQLEQGVQNVTVRLIGQYSHFSSQSTATMGAGITIDSVSNVSSTEEDAVISIDPLSYTGGRTVTVSTPNVSCAYQPNSPVVGVTYAGCTPGSPNGTGTEIVTANVFAIIPGPAIISSVAPATGNEGQEVVFNITGSATHWAQNFTQFYIAGGGSDLTINSVVINSATSATVDLSISPTANPGARSVYMVTNGESLTDSGAFVVTGGVPVITYLSPGSYQNPAGGTTGLQVDIYGLYTNWATGSSTVSFGPGITVESFQVDNATHIEAVIDIAAGAQNGYRTVVVQTGAQGLLGNFQVTPVAPPPTPYIWYLSPGSGLPGQTFTVTFNGAYTQWNPDTTVLEGFASGITVNTFQVTSPTSARANITISPTAAASVSDLTLTTGSEVESAQFSVVVAVPTLSIVDPGSGIQGATNLTVDILGQYTTFDSTTTFSFGSGITTVGPPTILGPTIATQVINVPQLAPLGGSGVIANTPDASASAQIVGGASFSVTRSLALISAITPNTAPQGTALTVEVTGQNTHWNGSTTFQFGAGIVVTSIAVNSETDATLTLAVPALASEGPTGATAQTAGEVANISNGFVVTAGTPLLLSTGPGSVPQQDSVVFTILSQATTWSAATPPTVSYGPGITLTNVNVTGPTSLTVEGFVMPTTPVGYYPLTVSTGTQVLSLNNAVYVSPGPAVINNLTPNIGDQGVNLPAVQINGINTHWAQGVTQLTFPDVLINSFTVNSPTLITANITVNTTAVAGQYSVTATTGGEVATGVNVFTVSQSEPELLAVVPSSGVQGLTSSPVTITGAFTNFVNGTTTANFGTGITVNSVTVTSATQAQANITVQPTTTLGYRNVSVTTGSQVINLTNGYQVTQGPAEIVGALNPSSGGEGNSYNVVVTGSQTHFAQNVTTASFGGGIQVTGVTVTGLLSATVSITIPNSTPTGAYNVTLTTGGEVATILGGFTVTNGSAQISAVNPPTGTQGLANLNVALTGTFTHWVNGTSAASFGAGITVNTLTVSDATDAVANITISTSATIGSRTVTVTTGGEVASITGGFSVLAGVPTLLSASPTTAQAGTTANIVLTGVFTNFQQGFSTVSFGSGVNVNLVTVSSATQLTANISVSSSASVGNREITVSTNSQVVSLNNGFSITAGTPAITQINPNIGTDGQTLNVSLSGIYTNWVQGTTTISFGSGITVNTVTVSDATDLTANITIGASTPTGPVSVMTTTGGEVENVPGGFTVDPVTVPSPTLLSLSPSPSAGVMPINSNIIAVFSQPMNRTTITTSTVTLTLTSNPNGYIAVPISVNLDATGRILTITPTGLLGVNSTFNLIMTNAIQDAAGTAFGYYSQDLYTVDAANTTPTTLVTANPPSNTSNVGTNVVVQLEFSTTMNQSTQSGMTLMNGGTAVPGTISWNSNPYCCGTGWAQPGTVLTFTPTTPLAAGTTYTVSYGAPLADTAGNAITAGSFTFTTGSGADTTNNSVHFNFESGQTNLGTNFVPGVTFAKPINPIDITPSTLLLYNGDSGKYVGGTVSVAPNGMSATFTPTYPLLPDTYYYLDMSSGYYDMDGNYLYGTYQYFTTGAGSDLTPPTVASVSPAKNATSAPLNAEVVVHFSAAINSASVTNAVTVTPSGGSAIAGTTTLGSDLVTLTFVPTDLLQSNTVYTVQVSGYQDMVGNVGAPFSSSFTTATSSAVINVSTGLNAAGNLITTGDTIDPHWFVNGTSTNAEVVASTNADWWSPWLANGPTSSWIAPDPDVAASAPAGNTLSTTFNWSGSTTNICLAGAWGSDGYGTLELNGQPVLPNNEAYNPLTPFNVPISSSLTAGTNTLTLVWGSAYSGNTGFRLGAVVETCGASYTGGLTLTSSTPASGTTGVATNSTIALTFNNPLDPATVNSTTLPVMVGYNSNQEIAGTYVVTGNQVVFTPDSPFPVSTQIYVGAYNGPYDTAGDAAAGNGYVDLLNFTTNGTVVAPSAPFQVLAFAPASNATNVGLRAPVAATFNRSVSPGSINQNNANSDFALFTGDSQSPWCSSYSRSQDNTTLSFNCYPLPGSTVMTAFLNSNLTDWSGNPLTNFSSQFTTSPPDSNTNGSVITTRPGNGASGIGVNEPLTLYSNLPINAGTADGGIQVAQNNVAVPGSVAVLDNGYTLEFTPSSAWTQGALIQWWTNTSLLDSTYNTPINAASGYFYAAASTATLVPAVQVASPTNGATAPTNAIVDLQFNTPLNSGTVNSTNIYLYDGNTSLHLAGTYSTPQPNEVRIVPSAGFTPGHYIYVYVTTGLQSATSVPFGSTTYVIYFLTGTGADATLPTIVSAVPYNGSTNVGVNVTPGVVISKAIDPVSVNSNTFQVTNGGTPLPGTFWFNSSDTRVEFMPNAPLPAGSNLVMTVNGVLDPVGNPITSTTSFHTGPGPDFTAPTVVWTSVTSNESIPVNSSITVQFSESMDVTSFSNSNFFIQDQVTNTQIPTTLSWNANQTIAYLTPTSPLSAGRQYYFYVYSGTDLAGNTLQGESFYFYAEFTGATSAPTVINFNPLSGATGLGTNVIVEAQFSAPIDPNSVSGVTLTQGGTTVTTSPVLGSGNTVLQLVPATPLAPGTTYTMHITGVLDPAGNAVTPVNNSFTTGTTYDINPATAISSDPPTNATVGTNVTPKLVFNKALNPLTVNNSTFRMYMYDTGQFIPLTVTESTNGMEVTMTPQIPLLANTHYYFQACCGFQDQDGNDGNGVNIYFWTNGGTDTSGPTVTVSPLNLATGIPLNAQITASMSTNIDPTTVTQTSIKVLSGGIPITGTVTEPTNQELVFTPTGALTAGTTYTVQVSGFTDANGNAVAPFSSTFTTGTIAASGGLTLTSTSIVNGSNVTNNLMPITLTFNQTLNPSTVNLSTFLVMNSWNSNWGLAGTYVVNGNVVTFTPSNPYPPNATIYVGATGGLTDVAGDAYGGNPGNGWQQLLDFTTTGSTPDSTALTVLSVNPTAGATNVRPDTAVSITFNKGINPYSVYNNSNNALLFAGQSLADRGSITMSPDNRTMTFNSGTLSTGTTYTIQLPAGGVSDPSGNALAATYTSTFTTGTNPATGNGTVQSVAPGFNATGVPTDSLLTLYMNRQVDAASLSGQVTVTVNGAVYAGTVQSVASGFEIQFTPGTPFPNGATVQWFLSGSVLDVNGDAFTGNSGTFYTVAAVNTATAQPTMIGVSPVYGSSTMPINGEIDIAFTLPIDPTTVGGGNVYFNTGTAATISVLAAPNNNIIRVVPNANLTPGDSYYVCANSSVKGTNGVTIPGSCWNTNFNVPSTATTADTTSGTVAIGPPSGSTNVGTNGYIRLWFSKPVDSTTINSTNVAVKSGGVTIPGTWGYNYTNDDIREVNFSPVNPLPPSTPITVTTSGLLDYAGNTFTPASASFTTAALPDYTTPTATLDFGGGTTGIGTNAAFTCLYSEPMDPSSVTTSNTYVYSYVTNASIPVTYTWSSDMLSVTMTPTKVLFANSEYYYYCGGAIDLTGNGMSNTDVYFYTGNGAVSTGPVLVQANPPSGSTNVPLNSIGGPWNNTSLMLLFNEPVSTESMASITFTPNGGSAEPIAVYPEDGNFIASVQLPWTMVPSTTYTFNFAGVTDLNGNPATGTTTSSFTTSSTFDWSTPLETVVTPANGATGVGVNVIPTLTFTEAMNPALIDSNHVYLQTHNSPTVVPVTLTLATNGSGETVVTLTPTATLAESTIYDVVIGTPNWDLYDIAGNSFSASGYVTYNNGYVFSTFTTGTTAAVNGACGTANGQTFSSPPAANLCSAGTASTVTNPGSWTWSCNGNYGGTNASCSATVSGTPSCSPQLSSLVSLWPGNNNANDVGPGGNNGILENGVSYGLGEVGDAFSLSGSDQYMLIGQPVPANLQIQNAITLSAWIYPTALPTNVGGGGTYGFIVGSQMDGVYGGATIFFDGNTDPDGNSGVPPGHITFQIGDGSQWHETDALTQVPLNQWTLVTAVRAANNAAQIYYNGVLQPSSSVAPAWTGTISYPSTDWFAIGQEVNEDRPFTGLINDVAVYNAALTGPQVLAIYNAGSGGVCQ